MRLAYFDCFSGASGDMILGALLDAGLPLEALRRDVESLGLPGVTVRAEKTSRRGVVGTGFEVVESGGEARGRGLADIEALIAGADLPERVRGDAVRVFRRLAEVEAAVHGTTPEEIHFHEVGAVDSIADIVGAAAGLARLGIDEVLFSRLVVGRGHVACAHGLLPVPAPATARLIEGLEVSLGEGEGELLTPTGAAVLTTLGRQAPPPSMRFSAVGYGAGRRDRRDMPNLLRVWIGQRAAGEAGDTVWVLETNLDDCSPEVIGYALDRVWAAGALDVFVTAIQMKKSRPGVKVTALAPAERVQAVEETLFRETSTFGVRRYEAMRSKLDREMKAVSTPYGEVRLKEGRLNGRVVSREPEYEDCRRIAEAGGMPVREVMDLVKRLAAEQLP